MKTFSERVAYAINLVGGQNEMARRCSDLKGKLVTQSNIRYLIKGRGNGSVPTYSGLTPFIAEAAGLNTDWLATGEGEMTRPKAQISNLCHDAAQQDHTNIKGNSSAPIQIRAWDNVDELAGDGFIPFPVLRVNLSAGQGEEVVEVDTELQPVEFPLNIVRREGALPGDCAAMYVKGTSMLPQFNDGDCVLIDYKRKQILDNKIYALVWQGEYFLKRILKKADGGLILVSDNKIGNPDKEIPVEYVHEVYVIGRAIAKAGGVY